MSRPRFRLTVRGIMLGVGAAGVIFALCAHRQRLRTIAADHEARVVSESRPIPTPGGGATPPGTLHVTGPDGQTAYRPTPRAEWHMARAGELHAAASRVDLAIGASLLLVVVFGLVARLRPAPRSGHRPGDSTGGAHA